MITELEDARNLAHGTYADVIVVEHRNPTGSATRSAPGAPPHVVLEFAEGTRVIDRSGRFEIDGLLSDLPPTVGAAYRVTIGPAAEMAAKDLTVTTALRYETMNR